MIASVTVATRVGFSALRANPARTLLATLGVVIGSASLVSILSVSDGVERFARTQIARQGFDRLAIRPITFDTVDGMRIPRTTVSNLGVADLEALVPTLKPGERALLTTMGLGRVRFGDGTRDRAVMLTAVAASAADTEPPLVSGRRLTAEEMRTGAPVAVVNRKLAAALAGSRITIADRELTVVGVTDDGASNLRGTFAATVPFALGEPALRVSFGPPSVATLLVVARKQEELPALRTDVERWLGTRDRAWRASYEVQARAESMLSAVSKGLLIFRLLMGSITGITLVVGGIGIMNVLLASVAERTREIGVRKAVGARRRDIVLQFLAESVTITGAGSAIGTAFGLLAAFGVTALMRAKADAVIYAAVTPQTLAVSALAAIIVGLIFGSYPAARAARMVPIDAIRTE